MSSRKSYPIFYDKKHRRFRYSRRMLVLIISFIFSVFSVTFASIAIGPSLPNFEIDGSQVQTYHKSPRHSFINEASGGIGGNDARGIQSLQKQNQSSNFSKVDPEIIAYYVNWDDNSFSSLKKNVDTIDQIIPEWLLLSSSDGNISLLNEQHQAHVIDFIKRKKPEMEIIPMVSNYNEETQQWDRERVLGMLGDSNNRSSAIDNLYNYVRRNDMDGISIDFENIPSENQKDLELFMKELYARFNPSGLRVLQSIPLYNFDFNAKNLAQYADYLILMAYDEHHGGSEISGPIASKSWFENGIAKRFSEIPSEKYIISLGNYGYDWMDNKAGGNALTFQESMRLARKSASPVELDAVSLNSHFVYLDEEGTSHQVWFLDGISAFNQVSTVLRMGNPYGFSFWRMGSEDPSLWKVFSKANRLDEEMANDLRKMEYGYDVDYSGKGEILRVVESPREGMREMVYDHESGLVVVSRIVNYPSPYVVNRWGADQEKKIALTFDDGPDRKYTSEILDILKEYEVPASFFVIGANANINQDIVRRIFAEGHTLGNHTYTHPNIAKITDSQFTLELDSTQRILEAITGRKTLLFRPPYAEDIEPTTPEQIAPLERIDKAGYYTAGMHIDPTDWDNLSADQITKRVLKEAKAGKGNVVLLHDGGGNREETVRALPKIIEGLRVEGFEIVELSSLIGVSRDELMPKVSFSERVLAGINGISVLSVSWFVHFLKFMFVTGIFLGLLRFVFIVTLSAVQWFYSRYGPYRKKSAEDFQPKVSVIIPAYNEGKVIIKTVLSILNSNYDNFDIIVVDDGSRDNTFDLLLESFSDNPKVKLFKREKNAGKSEALNFGIEKSDSEIVVTLDADTIFSRLTIKKLVRRFMDARVAAVAGNAKVGNRNNIMTRWQALEYVTSQNLDKRAYELLNGIAVVPGAVGAWRKSAVEKAGGFSSDTLAEDTDLTLKILRQGSYVAYDEEAKAFTEAPESVKNFLKQRFRWMFGTLQSIWKHKDTLFRKRYGSLGMFTIPNIFVFQIFFPLIAPLMDLMVIFSSAWAIWQNYYHPDSYSAFESLRQLLIYYALFLLIDLITAVIPFFLEHDEDWTLLVWLPFQRFFYRQLIYYVAVKSVFTAIKGTLVGWGKFERKDSVRQAVKV